MAYDTRINMKTEVESVRNAVAKETDPQKRAVLEQHGAAYLEGLAKKHPEQYAQALQAHKAQANQGAPVPNQNLLTGQYPNLGNRLGGIKGDVASGVLNQQQGSEARAGAAANADPRAVDDYFREQMQKANQGQPIRPTEQMGGSGLMGRTPAPQVDANYPMSPQERQMASAGAMQGQGMAQGQTEPPGIFSKLGSGLQSAGKSMGGYAEKLFNDPSRMAMLQGGLSMMNPNSYYDKQGFGSVFQGLQAGLGQAQSGHEGVIARRKAQADIAGVKATAQKNARGGKLYNIDVGNGMEAVMQDGQEISRHRKRFKPPPPPALVKLQAARDALPDGDPRREEIQRKIDKSGFTPDQFIATQENVYQAHPQFGGGDSERGYEVKSILGKGHRPPTKEQVATAGSNVSAAGRGIANVGDLYEKLSVSGAMIGGELFGGNVVSNWNTIVDNIGWDSLSNDNRSDIDSLQNSLKRDLPKEFLQDDKSKSNFDKKLVLDSFGYDRVSSSKTKMKAMPDVLGLLYEKYVKNSQVVGDPPVGLRAYLEHNKIPEALIKRVEAKSNGSFSADPFKSGKKKFQAGSGKGKFY